MRGRFENFPLPLVELTAGYLQPDLHAGNAARVGGHDFIDGCAGTVYVQSVVPGADTHDGEHTARQGGSAQIGRRKCLALALIIGWGISNNPRAGTQVYRFCTEIAEIGCFNHSETG